MIENYVCCTEFDALQNDTTLDQFEWEFSNLELTILIDDFWLTILIDDFDWRFWLTILIDDFWLTIFDWRFFDWRFWLTIFDWRFWLTILIDDFWLTILIDDFWLTILIDDFWLTILIDDFWLTIFDWRFWLTILIDDFWLTIFDWRFWLTIFDWRFWLTIFDWRFWLTIFLTIFDWRFWLTIFDWIFQPRKLNSVLLLTFFKRSQLKIRTVKMVENYVCCTEFDALQNDTTLDQFEWEFSNLESWTQYFHSFFSNDRSWRSELSKWLKIMYVVRFLIEDFLELDWLTIFDWRIWLTISWNWRFLLTILIDRIFDWRFWLTNLMRFFKMIDDFWLNFPIDDFWTHVFWLTFFKRLQLKIRTVKMIENYVCCTEFDDDFKMIRLSIDEFEWEFPNLESWLTIFDWRFWLTIFDWRFLNWRFWLTILWLTIFDDSSKRFWFDHFWLGIFEPRLRFWLTIFDWRFWLTIFDWRFLIDDFDWRFWLTIFQPRLTIFDWRFSIDDFDWRFKIDDFWLTIFDWRFLIDDFWIEFSNLESWTQYFYSLFSNDRSWRSELSKWLKIMYVVQNLMLFKMIPLSINLNGNFPT